MSTILCVVSEPAGEGLLENSLRELGYRTVMVSGVPAALAAAKVQPLDLILAEDRPPDGNGVDLLCALQEDEREIPVIIMTDHSSVEGALTCMRHGAIEYLTRPLHIEALRLAVSNALAVVRLRHENALILARHAAVKPARPGRPTQVAWPVEDAGGAGAREPADGETFNLVEMQRGLIRRALTATDGNRTRAARMLGISERTLRKKLNSGFLEAR